MISLSGVRSAGKGAICETWASIGRRNIQHRKSEVAQMVSNFISEYYASKMIHVLVGFPHGNSWADIEFAPLRREGYENHRGECECRNIAVQGILSLCVSFVSEM